MFFLPATVITDACTDVGECGGITNVECRDDGPGLQCLCLTGYSATGATNCDPVGMYLVREKQNNMGSDQVRHKPACTVTEDGERLEILDLESRGIVLSV